MAERGKGLSDEALGQLVDRKLADSVNWYNTNLSQERAKVLKYYNGELPAKQKESSSSFVSNEVYDAVEMMKAQLLETFAAGREIIKFDPVNPQDVEEARIATAYCDHVVFSQNDGYGIFNDVINDGLIARVGVAKVYWDEDYKDTEMEFDGLPEEAITMAAGDEAIPKLDAEQDPVSGLFSGKMTKREDTSQVKIEVLNPEEFAIEPQAKYLGPEWFCTHRTLKSIDDLVKMGYKEKDILEAGAASSKENATGMEIEKIARNQIQAGFPLAQNEDEEKQLYWLNECYIKVRLEGDSYAKLYKVLRLGNKTLDKQEIDKHPFVAYRPLPIPHAFYGNNYAARVIPAQNVRTVLTRAIVDHAAITVNPRYVVLKGGLTNPKELLDNRLGGLVNVTRPDAIQPLVQEPLNPFVFQTLELIKTQNEETTGISSLSQGLNKDAISQQNSDAMVERLVGLSQTRQKIIARNFANEFLIPLYLKVYELVIAKEKKEKIIEICGNWVPINPSQWRDRSVATASVHLGYKEHDNEAQRLVQTGALLNQDPILQTMFTPQNRYNLAVDIMKLQGHKNFNAYLTPPQGVPPKQPDPIEMAKVQAAMTTAQAAMLNAQANMKKVDMHGAIESSREAMQERQNEFDNVIAERDMHRKDIDMANKIDISQREMVIAESAPVTKEQAIVSPK